MQVLKGRHIETVLQCEICILAGAGSMALCNMCNASVMLDDYIPGEYVYSFRRVFCWRLLKIYWALDIVA